MKQLNLLPLADQRRDAQRRLIIGMGIMVLAGAGLGVAGWLAVQAQQHVLENRAIATVKAPKASPTPKAGSGLETLPARIAALNALSVKETEWAAVFTAVNGIIPQGVQLTGMSLTHPVAGTTLKISGNCSSNTLFARFVSLLRNDPRFTSVAVDTYAYTVSTGGVSFGITLVTRPEVFVVPISTPAP